MNSPRLLLIPLSRGHIAGLAALLAGFNLLLLGGTAVEHALADSQPWRVRFVAVQFSLALENNLAAWYASMLLLSAALAMTLCFVVDSRAGNAQQGRVFSGGWLLMAALFVGLSLDELGSLHERIDSIPFMQTLENPTQLNVPGWAGILALPVLFVCLFMLGFAWLRLRQSRAAFALMAVGFVLFASVPLQEAMELRHASAGVARDVAPLLLEEGTELFASLAVLAGALCFALEKAARASGAETVLVIRPRLDLLMGVEALFALAMLSVAVGLSQVMDMQDGRGITLNWFPAALAFVIALICAYFATGRFKGTPAGRVRWAFLAALHLGLSIDHGSAHRFTQDLLAGMPAVRTLLDAALIGIIVVAAVLTMRATSTFGTRVALTVWAMLLVAPVAFDIERAWLAFGAYALLLPVLATLLPRSAHPARGDDGASAPLGHPRPLATG